MNLHQLRFVREAVRQKFNLTEVAKVLFTSQPGVSKAIIELEDELGISIFRRHGKRIRGLTEAGRIILQSIETIMQEVDDMKRIGQEFSAGDQGNLIVVATHSPIKYILPSVVPTFIQKFPNVHLSIIQRKQEDICDLVSQDKATLAIATGPIASREGIVSYPVTPWEFCLVTRNGHPLSQLEMITLADIAQYPIVTYDTGFYGRSMIDMGFSNAQVHANIQTEVSDADVIKTYAMLGDSVGIILSIAYQPEVDKNLVCLPIGHLIGSGQSFVLFRRNAYLQSYVFSFIEMLYPQLTRKIIEEKLSEN